MRVVTWRSKYCDISVILATISMAKTMEEQVNEKLIELMLKKIACATPQIYIKLILVDKWL